MYYPPQAYDPTLLYSKGVKGRTHIWDQDSDIELTSPPKKPYEKERSVSVLEELPPPSRKVYIPKKKESQERQQSEEEEEEAEDYLDSLQKDELQMRGWFGVVLFW